MADQPVRAYAFEGERFDCGSKLGYLKATVAYGLNHAQGGDDFKDFLRTLVAD